MRLILVLACLFSSACAQKITWAAPDSRAIMRDRGGYFKDTEASKIIELNQKGISEREKKMWSEIVADEAIVIRVIN